MWDAMLPRLGLCSVEYRGIRRYIRLLWGHYQGLYKGIGDTLLGEPYTGDMGTHSGNIRATFIGINGKGNGKLLYYSWVYIRAILNC